MPACDVPLLSELLMAGSKPRERINQPAKGRLRPSPRQLPPSGPSLPARAACPPANLSPHATPARCRVPGPIPVPPSSPAQIPSQGPVLLGNLAGRVRERLQSHHRRLPVRTRHPPDDPRDLCTTPATHLRDQLPAGGCQRHTHAPSVAGDPAAVHQTLARESIAHPRCRGSIHPKGHSQIGQPLRPA